MVEPWFIDCRRFTFQWLNERTWNSWLYIFFTSVTGLVYYFSLKLMFNIYFSWNISFFCIFYQKFCNFFIFLFFSKAFFGKVAKKTCNWCKNKFKAMRNVIWSLSLTITITLYAFESYLPKFSSLFCIIYFNERYKKNIHIGVIKVRTL